jgi:hypothetical protein
VVVVFHAAVRSLPVTDEVSFAVVARRNPTSSFVGWSSPIAFVPLVTLSYGIPITLHPREFRTRAYWRNPNHAGWRWCPDDNSNGNLRVNG